MKDIPTLDGPYTTGNTELHRIVYDYFGELRPHLDETDSQIAIPLRLVHDQASGWHLELGPYAIDPTDIDRLRQAIHAHDLAAGTTPPPASRA